MPMIQAFDKLAARYEQELDDLRDENARFSRMMEKLCVAARDAADTIEEAMEVHIYNDDHGEAPDEGCAYAATVKELRALADESEHLFDDLIDDEDGDNEAGG